MTTRRLFRRLSELLDVTSSTPADNNVLAYDTATSKYINQTAAQAGLAAASHAHAGTDITSGTIDVARIPTAIPAASIAGGAVDNTEYGYLNGVTSAIQTQMDLKATLASPTLTGTVTLPDVTMGDGKNFTFNATTGTKFGTTTTGKVSFFNATPVAQQANTVDLRAVAINLGFLASGGATPLDLNGGIITAVGSGLTSIPQSGVTSLTSDLALKSPLASPTFTGTVTLPDVTMGDAKHFTFNATTGTKFGTTTTGKVSFFNATPVAQQANTTDLRAVIINMGFLASGGATPLDLNGGIITAVGSGLTALNASNVSTGTLAEGRLPTGIDAAKIGGGAVSNTEFSYLDGVTSAIQTQMDLKAPKASPVFTGDINIFSAVNRLRFHYDSQASADYPAQVGSDGSGNLLLASRGNNASGVIFYYSAGSILAEAGRITTAGRFGFGVTGPSEKCEVGSANADDVGFMISTHAGAAPRLRFGHKGGGGVTNNVGYAQVNSDDSGNVALSTRTNNASYLAFHTCASTTGVERIRILSGGNVGIGLSNPSTALEVSGTVTATEFVGGGAGLTGVPDPTITEVLTAGNTAGGLDLSGIGVLSVAEFDVADRLTLPAYSGGAPVAGSIAYDSGTIKYYNGSMWISLATV